MFKVKLNDRTFTLSAEELEKAMMSTDSNIEILDVIG